MEALAPKRLDVPLPSIPGMTGTWVRVKDAMRRALRGVNQGGTAVFPPLANAGGGFCLEVQKCPR